MALGEYNVSFGLDNSVVNSIVSPAFSQPILLIFLTTIFVGISPPVFASNYTTNFAGISLSFFASDAETLANVSHSVMFFYNNIPLIN